MSSTGADQTSDDVGDLARPSGEAALAQMFRALGEPTRLRLLSLVAAHENSEATVLDLTAPTGLRQPTVSHHLKILVESGLLTREKRGVWSVYALVPGALGALGQHLKDADEAWTSDVAQHGRQTDAG